MKIEARITVISFLLIIVLTAALPLPAIAEVLGFDDLQQSQQVPIGYRGYYFMNLIATDLSKQTWIGYMPCSGSIAADSTVNENAWVSTILPGQSGRLIDFDGACLSTYGGKWAPTQLTVNGYRGGQLIKSIVMPLRADAMEYYGFRMLGVDTVEFVSNGTVGGYILIDNLTISEARNTAVPFLLQ